MKLNAGSKLGPYEIVSALGAGGMGEVYKARDTRLDRIVAIKILAADLASSPDLKQRFEREAKAISSLNHRHICTLYDVGHQDGIDFLVMEYLEGQSLADRLKRGPLPVNDALKIAIEIAEALEKAHRQGLVHRDLKPGNIMLTRAGAKLLDFGLAKPLLAGISIGSGSPLPVSAAATITSPSPQAAPLTAHGTVVGTFQYMSPEQVEGLEADPRSDLFALGTVIYEMITGKRAFEGKSQAAISAAILERQPPPISEIRPIAPAALDRLVGSCMAKDPEQRRQTAHDVLLDLEWIAEEEARPSRADAAYRVRPGRIIAWVGLTAVLCLATAGATWLWFRPAPAPARTMRFAVTLPAGQSLGGSWYWYPSVAISPDGSVIAYVAHQGGISRLYLRPVNDLEPHAIPGTEGAHTPFFSPDGRWLGAYLDQKLVKIPAGGGPPVTIAKLSGTVMGACWAPDDTIYFGMEAPLGLQRVPAAGGTPKQVTTLNQETDQSLPSMLPGGKTLLFVSRHGDQPSFDEAEIVAFSLANGERKTLIKAGTNPHFVAPGSLVFVRSGVLMAVRFDPAKLELVGEARPLLDGVLENPRIGAGQFSVSDTGSLVYVPGGISYGEHELVLVDMHGAVRTLTAKTRPYEDLTISPDGRFIAATVEGAVTDTWIHDIARDTDTRFTYGVEHRDPAWTTDGKRVTYDGYKDGKYGLFWKPFDGSGPEETLVTSSNPMFAWFWSPDRKYLLYQDIDPVTNDDVWLLNLEDRKTRPLFKTPYDDEWASFSPDGRWIAYNSDESGRSEVYVVPFPALTPRIRVSTEGGLHPLWSPNSRELYYRTGVSMEAMVERTLAAGTAVMAVPIETSPEFKVGTPRKLFEGPYFNSSHDYAITPDGKGFVLIRERSADTGPNEIRVVLNWRQELQP